MFLSSRERVRRRVVRLSTRRALRQKSYRGREHNAAVAMAGFLPPPRAASRRPFWPRDLQRGAITLGLSGAVFWSSFAAGRWIIPVADVGPIYLDLLLAWVAVGLHVAAWPELWVGLRDLRARQPDNDDGGGARRGLRRSPARLFPAASILSFRDRTFSTSEA